MNYVDILLLIPLAYGLIRGLFKGLIHEIASLASIVIGLLLAYHFSDDLALFLSNQLNEDGAWVKILAYLLIFVGVAIILQVISYIITKMLNLLALGMINRLLGGIFGLGKILLVLLLLIFLLDPYLENLRKDNEAWRQSIVYDELRRYSDIPGELLTRFREEQIEEVPSQEQDDFTPV